MFSNSSNPTQSNRKKNVNYAEKVKRLMNSGHSLFSSPVLIKSGNSGSDPKGNKTAAGLPAKEVFITAKPKTKVRDYLRTVQLILLSSSERASEL